MPDILGGCAFCRRCRPGDLRTNGDRPDVVVLRAGLLTIHVVRTFFTFIIPVVFFARCVDNSSLSGHIHTITAVTSRV